MSDAQNALDIQNMSIAELEQLRIDAAEQIQIQTEKEVKQDLREIVAIAKRRNFSVIEILKALRDAGALTFGGEKTGEVRKVYYNPKYPLELYVGIGRKPKWLIELEEKEGDIEKYSFEP